MVEEAEKKRLYEYVLKVKSNKRDMEAWDFLYLGYRNYLLAVIRKIIYDTGSHQDVLQEIWIKLYKHIDKFDEGREFESWLGKVAANVCFSWLSKNKMNTCEAESEDKSEVGKCIRDVSYSEQFQEDAAERNYTEDFAALICDRDAIENAFSGIKDKRQVLACKYRLMDGLSIKAISEILEVPESTLHNWIYRVKDKLAPILKKTD